MADPEPLNVPDANGGSSSGGDFFVDDDLPEGTSCWHSVKKSSGKHLFEGVLTIVLLVGDQIFDWLAAVHSRPFFERDPALSHPYVADQEIPMVLLFMLCLILPALGLVLVQFGMRYRDLENKFSDDLVRSQLCLVQSLVFCHIPVNFLKKFCGRHRPNFFAFCNYKGYATAIETGDYTQYFNATTPGAQGDISFCLNRDALNEARESFPSGHASSTAAGLGFFCFFLFGAFDMSANHKTHKLVTIGFVWLIIAIVGATRTRDSWHNFDDVVAGIAIGLLSACMCYISHYRSTTNRKLHPELRRHLQ
mmetsp:Transcript_46880/g.92272  ORF Transcript_46880/g.92272 Transcript_46880/m.92272 type:complete len:307 (+) Transcript_46880:67-987(+)|eukprot:CAMPEP_0175167624 /NCGR_PEP_ID=MMETSP0087-20121206/28454_1 /TAXON_ID=136419 /ORGANISM="Unknown Unknown, Strain D1" /LENGTH=306 /DNA_ID=CAMNT_0016457551 /DNA_START=71 /DNA_END=991 /DNA_ORIENTATION=+